MAVRNFLSKWFLNAVDGFTYPGIRPPASFEMGKRGVRLGVLQSATR
jgi:hypothetical protein